MVRTWRKPAPGQKTMSFEHSEPKTHWDIRGERHAERITLDELNRMTNRLRVGHMGCPWNSAGLASIRQDMLRLFSVERYVGHCMRNREDDPRSELARGHMKKFLSDILEGKCARWIYDSEFYYDDGWLRQNPESLNKTSVSCAFVLHVYRQLIRVGITTIADEEAALEEGMRNSGALKEASDADNATKRKWIVRLFPERIGELFREMDE